MKTLTTLIDWVRINLLAPRQFKQPQLWLWGGVNTHKTSFVRLLEKFYRIYHVPHEEFDSFYQDELFDLAFCDEWVPTTRKIDWVLQFSQGDTMTLKTKGGQVIKKKNIPLIVASNYPILTAFHQDNLEAVRARFLEVRVASPLLTELIQFNDQSYPPPPQNTFPQVD